MTDLFTDRLCRWDPTTWSVAHDWRPLVAAFFSSAEGLRLGEFMQRRLAAGATVFPPQPLYALALTPLRTVKVVILGQDPYHGPGQAQGLAFSVPPGVRAPPSLCNILAEIDRERRAGELQAAGPRGPSGQSSDLRCWSRQGVLLLNTCMTVEQGAPGSHASVGWEALTDRIIQAIAGKLGPVVFLLWGAQAQARRPVGASGGPRLVLQANHPSPLSARRKPVPFIGCNHFALANAFLVRHGADPIDW